MRDEPSASDPQLTTGNFAGGTPGYLAPEQALGEAIDGRTDLYSLGCLAYWLVTGTMVFEGDTVMKIITDHIHEPPTPPSERADQAIPSDLEEIILTCLAKDPAQRPQNATLLDQALAACENSAGWSAEQAQQWWDAHPTA